MRTPSTKTIPKVVWRSVLQGITVAIIVAFLLSFVYGFVYYYQQKVLHVQRLAALLASNASTTDGAALISSQVSFLLDDDPTLKNIVFYSTNAPIEGFDQTTAQQTGSDWYNAFLTDSISFNRIVTNRYVTDSSVDTSNQQPVGSIAAARAGSTSSAELVESNSLVGYINITLDIDKLRLEWLRKIIFSWFATMTVGMTTVWFILRKLNWPTKDVIELAKVCDIVVDNPNLEQLPVIQQRFDFQELIRIKKAFVLLFDRLQVAQQDYEAVADFEKQLHNKERSLDIQRRNFQSMITHELKTSLNAISGGLQLLDNRYLNEEQRDTLAIIRGGSQHLESTLEQIIQLNKIEKGQVAIRLSEFNPLQIIADLIAEFDPIAKQKGLELISRVHHIDYTFEGDASKIQQILAALIDNAIKFTQKGQVVIESQLTHINENIRWQLKVIDTGIGINADYIDDIFTPFFQVDSSTTREYEGAGVGLPVVKHMLHLIGASIEVESTLGAGSQFTTIIPLRNKYQSWQQTLLKGLNIIYFHLDKTGFLVKELQRFGATVICQQHEQLVMEQIATMNIDIVMFAEDIVPTKAAQLASMIRSSESIHRTLLIYWYPAHETRGLERMEFDLKVAGIDYCHSAPNKTNKLAKLLKNWLVQS